MKGLSKKYFSMLVVVLIALSVGFAYGADVVTSQGFHPLQQVSMNIAGNTLTSVDSAGNGYIDEADLAANSLLLNNQQGSYYLDLDNEVNTCINCLTNTEVASADYADNAGSASNADKVDNKHAADFTLDYVLSNGAITTTYRPGFNGGDGSNPPFSVDSSVRITNLNADLLDGRDSTGFCWSTGANCPALGGGVTSLNGLTGDVSIALGGLGGTVSAVAPTVTLNINTPTLQQVTTQDATTTYAISTGGLTTTVSNGPAITALSGAAGSHTSIAVGKTAGEARFAITAAAGQYASDADAGDAVLRVDSSGNKLRLLAGAGDSVLTVSSSNVGIGTETMNSKLQVHNGNIRVSDTTSGISNGAEYGINSGAMVIKGTYNSAVSPLLYQTSYGSDDISFVGDINVAGNAIVTGYITRNCPTGYLKLGTVCVQTTPVKTGQSTWTQSRDSCYSAGARLCTFQELDLACSYMDDLGNTAWYPTYDGDLYRLWTSDVHVSGGAFTATIYGVNNFLGSIACGDSPATAALTANSGYGRVCCRDI